jgi:hypothetical protein
MILVRLMGGLGNQMFQYALGRKLSLLHNTDLFMDTSFLDKSSKTHVKREYELYIFDLPASLAGEKELDKFEGIRKSTIKSRLQHVLPSLMPYHIITESSHAFDPKILRSPENTLLVGFWQTEKYFIDIEDSIRNDFKFSQAFDVENKAIAEKIISSHSVSLHVRRGDYVSNSDIQKHHGICSIEYYNMALSQITSKHKNVELFVFSDEPEWVKQNMRFDLPATYITRNRDKTASIDMHLMSLCKHNIIANSSFSWWAAWLNGYKDKIVIAPKNWVADKTLNTNDVIPDNWIKI